MQHELACPVDQQRRVGHPVLQRLKASDQHPELLAFVEVAERHLQAALRPSDHLGGQADRGDRKRPVEPAGRRLCRRRSVSPVHCRTRRAPTCGSRRSCGRGCGGRREPPDPLGRDRSIRRRVVRPRSGRRPWAPRSPRRRRRTERNRRRPARPRRPRAGRIGMQIAARHQRRRGGAGGDRGEQRVG